MRVLLILGVVVLFTLACADHKESHDIDDKDDHDHDDDHDNKDDHDDDDDDDDDHKHGHDKKGKHHGSLACHKIAPYNTKFAFDLYRHVARDYPSGNFAISPISISIGLAFLSHAARDHTSTQIIEGMGFNTTELTVQEMNEGFHQLLNQQEDADRGLQLSSGNALFISKEHKILQTFLDDAKKLYQSDAFSTDFTNTEEAKNQINSYVKKNTHGKIPKLLDSVDQNAVVALINYIYLKAKWEKSFDEKLTQEKDFHVNESKTVKAHFMTTTGMYRVASDDEMVVVTIPFYGNLKALFIMTKPGKLYELEQNLTYKRSMVWRKRLRKQFVEVSIPKFSISGTINLKETLSKMGIVDVFSDNADLSGITGEDNLKISEIVHEASFTVDEKGREAAGATTGEAKPMMHHASIVFNCPFLFTLHDLRTRGLLLAARVVNPQE